MEIDQTTIVLCDKRWINVWKSSLIAVPIVLLVMTAAFIFALSTIFPDAPWEELPAFCSKSSGTVDWAHALLRHFDLVIMTAAVFAQILYLNRVQRLERLTLSADGIHYVSPLPPMLKRLKPDWSLPWTQVRKVELGTLNARPRNAEFALLTFVSATDKRRIFPLHWVDANNYSPAAFRFTFSFTLSPPTNDEVIKSAMASEVVRYISRHVPHIAIDTSPGQAEVFTSLEKNPHGRIALGIVALLIAYAVIDMMAGPDAYIDAPSTLLHIYIPAGIIGALLSGIWLSGSSLPLGEKTGLALLIGMLVGVALIPGALRINALTDTNAGATYDCFVLQNSDGVILRPVADRMPAIDYFASNPF